jgi:hypothetical protein
MSNSSRHPESSERRAMAFADAVRDILRTDGVFHLADPGWRCASDEPMRETPGSDDRGSAVWQWDGVRWTRLVLDEPVAELPSRGDVDDGESWRQPADLR